MDQTDSIVLPHSFTSLWVVYSSVETALVAGVAMATAQVGPFSAFLQHPAIDYGTGVRTDRVATLHDRIRSGEVVLRFDEPRGFLDPLLELLTTKMNRHSSLPLDTWIFARKGTTGMPSREQKGRL